MKQVNFKKQKIAVKLILSAFLVLSKKLRSRDWSLTL